MGYAFISYSTRNQPMADSMKQMLNNNNIDSWMAPNDIPVGEKYAKVINTAIKECDCVILMLSQAAQNSVWVSKEIERAINYKKVIIPIKLEDMTLNDEFELYISSDQIIALKKFDEDSPEVKRILKSVSAACGYHTDEPAEKHIKTPKKKKHKFIFAALLIAAVLLVAFLYREPYDDTITVHNDITEEIPFVDMSETDEYIYPFIGFGGFSFKKNAFLMENKETKKLSMVKTSTGQKIPGNEEIELDITGEYDNYWVVKSEESDIIYIVDNTNNNIKIYDSKNNVWKNKDGITLSLESGEVLAHVFAGIKNLKSSIIDTDDIYLFICDSGENGVCYTKIIRVTDESELTETDISDLGISEVMFGFKREVSRDICPVLVWNTDGVPILIDLLTGEIAEEKLEIIYKNYMHYANSDNQTVSADGKYIIKRNSYTTKDNESYLEITLWNLEDGNSAFKDQFMGNNYTAFSKDGRLLVYAAGELKSIDPETGDAKVLLNRDYFESNRDFGEIPFALHYSDKLDWCIWDMWSDTYNSDIVIITDLDGQVLYRYDYRQVPFDWYYTDTFVGDDFIIHMLVAMNDGTESGERDSSDFNLYTIPLKVSYSKGPNDDIYLK